MVREVLFGRNIEKLERAALFVLRESPHDFQTRRIAECGEDAVNRDVPALRIPNLPLARILDRVAREMT